MAVKNFNPNFTSKSVYLQDIVLSKNYESSVEVVFMLRPPWPPIFDVTIIFLLISRKWVIAKSNEFMYQVLINFYLMLQESDDSKTN